MQGKIRRGVLLLGDHWLHREHLSLGGWVGAGYIDKLGEHFHKGAIASTCVWRYSSNQGRPKCGIGGR